MLKQLIIILLLLMSLGTFAMNLTGLDVRTVSEVRDNPAPRSINIPLSDLNKKTTSVLNKNQEIYVFCEAGFRAEKAKKILNELGFRRVINIKSWRDWNRVKSVK